MQKLKQYSLHAPQFLTEKRSLSHFLILVLFFSFLFCILYRPLGSMGVELPFIGRPLPLYTIVIILSGLLTLMVSRILLYQVQRKATLRMWILLVWLAGEYVLLTIELSAIALHLNIIPGVSYLYIILRTSLSLLAVLLFPYLISILRFQLREKDAQIQALNAMLLQQQRHATIQYDDMLNFYDKSGHLVFATKKQNILYFAAADNYTNVYYLNEGSLACYIHHSSMKQVEENYASRGIIRCHRGYMVNIENVKLLRREKDNLIIELLGNDTLIPVSKSYVETVAHCFSPQP